MVVTLCFFEMENYYLGGRLLGTACPVSRNSVRYLGTPDKLQNVTYFIIFTHYLLKVLTGTSFIIITLKLVHRYDTKQIKNNKCIASSGASLPKASGKSRSVEHFSEQL